MIIRLYDLPTTTVPCWLLEIIMKEVNDDSLKMTLVRS